jgi:hypothetical protein
MPVADVPIAISGGTLTPPPNVAIGSPGGVAGEPSMGADDQVVAGYLDGGEPIGGANGVGGQRERLLGADGPVAADRRPAHRCRVGADDERRAADAIEADVREQRQRRRPGQDDLARDLAAVVGGTDLTTGASADEGGEDDDVRGGGDAQTVATAPWHFLYFLPLPQGQGSFRPTLG